MSGAVVLAGGDADLEQRPSSSHETRSLSAALLHWNATTVDRFIGLQSESAIVLDRSHRHPAGNALPQVAGRFERDSTMKLRRKRGREATARLPHGP